MELVRGDIVIGATPGDYGKPRPAVIVQSDLFNATHSSIVLCLITSHLEDAPLFRVPVPPGTTTDLKVPSQVMVDKIIAIPTDKDYAARWSVERGLKKPFACGWNWH